jgi:hypothetical protein
VACLAATALLATGCGDSTVEVDAPELAGETARTCAALVDALPQSVDGAKRRSVEPAGKTAAAWGDPAIVLRCGVRKPRGFDRFATCQETNGVGWFIPEQQMTGAPRPITMTTIGRTVYVEVRLPTEHWPPAAAMVDLASAIKKTVRETDPCV